VRDKLRGMKRLDQQPLRHRGKIVFMPGSRLAPAARVTSQNNTVPLSNGGQRPTSGACDTVSSRLDVGHIGCRDWNRGDVDSLLVYMSDDLCRELEVQRPCHDVRGARLGGAERLANDMRRR
jgi:hypothetical protein